MNSDDLSSFSIAVYRSWPLETITFVEANQVLSEQDVTRMQSLVKVNKGPGVVAYCEKGGAFARFWRGRKEFTLNPKADLVVYFSEDGIRFE